MKVRKLYSVVTSFSGHTGEMIAKSPLAHDCAPLAALDDPELPWASDVFVTRLDMADNRPLTAPVYLGSWVASSKTPKWYADGDRSIWLPD